MDSSSWELGVPKGGLGVFKNLSPGGLNAARRPSGSMPSGIGRSNSKIVVTAAIINIYLSDDESAFYPRHRPFLPPATTPVSAESCGNDRRHLPQVPDPLVRQPSSSDNGNALIPEKEPSWRRPYSYQPVRG